MSSLIVAGTERRVSLGVGFEKMMGHEMRGAGRTGRGGVSIVKSKVQSRGKSVWGRRLPSLPFCF